MNIRPLRSSRRLAALSTLLLASAVDGTAQAQDPFAAAPGGRQGPQTASSAAPSPAPPPAATPEARCEHVTSAVCQQQNTPLLGVSAAYVAVSVLLVSVWRGWWNRRGTSSAQARLIAPMLTAATLAAILSGTDPAGGDDLRCCVTDKVLRSEILLQDSSLGRAFLLGAIPAIALYMAVVLVSSLVKK